MNGEYRGEERRKRPALDSKEINDIKLQLLESIYADIGRSIVKKILWVGGAVLVALLTWLSATGHIKF